MENSPEKENETQFLIHQQYNDGHVNSTTSTLEANDFHGNRSFDQNKTLEQNSLYNPPFAQSPYEIRRSSYMSPDPERNVSIKSVSPKTSNGPCKCCKCCTWKCCAISQTVILCIIGALILTGLGYMKYKTQKAGEQQDEFEAKGQQMEQMFAQNANESDSGRNWINGTYELKGYDENYVAYWEAFGVPSFVVSLIVGATETFVVTQSADKKTMHFKTSLNDGERVRERTMVMGKIEEVEWGEGRGVMHINCSLPEENLMVCDAEERVQKWKLSRDYIFSKIGILSHRIFHTKGVTAKKYYERVGVELSAEEMEEETKFEEGMILVEDNSDGDDPFGDDEEDEDSEWEEEEW